MNIWPSLVDTDLSLRFIDAGGVRTRVLEAGDGPPLVLMHGTGGHLEAFMRNIATLSQDFRVVAFDFVGHGYSDGPDEPYTIQTYSDHLHAVLETLGIKRAHLSGESLGGWVAAWFAVQHPERVDRLMLVCPGNVTMKLDVMERLKVSTRKAVAEASHEAVRARLEWLFAPDNRHLVTDELVDVRYGIYTRPNALATIENVLVLQDPEVRQRYTWTNDWCSQIVAPTLIFWTEHDPTGPPSEGELLREWIPGSELLVLPEAGHWPQWERPPEFDRIHREFLLTRKTPEVSA
jgi:2-hydroxy-6-oxonona-2,4-dienedioate hydrolase